MRSFWLAIQFLTRLPTPAINTPTETEFGEAIYHYPIVGFIIGFILFTTASLLDASVNSSATEAHGVFAVMILSTWVLLTGALHIDGLADSADAWIGGYGSKARTLKIMKDPACGPAGVTSIILLLLLKFTLIKLCFKVGIHYLIVAPLISRASIQVLYSTTVYVREAGLGSAMAHKMSLYKALLGISVTALFSLIYFPFAYCLLTAFLCALGWWGLRHLMIKRIDGFTGDTAGAWIEITECLCLMPLLWL
ncbi:MAG: adenosylcobinamide-GDP ribazoletransferase [Pseudomonadales bacterium]|nr:adenosylcobinamide-GDP ribazoletransferase [Pseudomonadales bacterium]